MTTMTTTEATPVTRTIETVKMRTLIEKAVNERGLDWIYPKSVAGCEYVYDPACMKGEDALRDTLGDPGELTPACVIGYALNLYDPELLPFLNKYARSCPARSLNAKFEVNNVGLQLSPGAILLANVAQSLSDTGAPWKYVVTAVYAASPAALLLDRESA